MGYIDVSKMLSEKKITNKLYNFFCRVDWNTNYKQHELNELILRREIVNRNKIWTIL